MEVILRCQSIMEPHLQRKLYLADESPPTVEIHFPGTSDVSSRESVEQPTNQIIFPRKTYPLCNQMHRYHFQ